MSTAGNDSPATGAGTAPRGADGRPLRLLVATTNAGKLRELAPILAEAGIEPVGLAAFPEVPVAPEDEDSFAANARAKARHYATATGWPVLADDSGLRVAALGGAPGVHSARFAGPGASDADNRSRLLSALDGSTDRRGEFVCALCLLDPSGRLPTLEVEGTCRGTLLLQERGAEGFGYDPLFVPDDPRAAGRSFGQMTRDEKRPLSHRGRALALLALRLSGAAPAAVAASGASAVPLPARDGPAAAPRPSP